MDLVERSEVLDPAPAQALAGLLGVSAPDLVGGEPLPLAWHWVYLLDRLPQADLGPDGHAVRGTVPLPPSPGMRRMFAGGTLRAHGELVCGERATRRTRIAGRTEKTGRSGPLLFVGVEHTITQSGRVVVEDLQQLVYRTDARRADAETANESGQGEPVAERPPLLPGEWRLEIDPVVLFRFSALTYNAHRVHYDREYALREEGYRGLLTHGPLQVIAMVEAARRIGCVEALGWQLEYRLTAPLLDFQGLVASAEQGSDGATTGVRDEGGRQTATGRLTRMAATVDPL
jgi:3-methylfumaryl-CoA hydratase